MAEALPFTHGGIAVLSLLGRSTANFPRGQARGLLCVRVCLSGYLNHLVPFLQPLSPAARRTEMPTLGVFLGGLKINLL